MTSMATAAAGMVAGPPAKVSRELQSAFYDDFKRQAVDAAKKRAVEQHVDYDTFKNMVLVAHLKPLHAPSTVHDASAPTWQFAPDGTILKAQRESGSVGSSAPTEPPCSSNDFEREWRRNCPSVDDKYRYLKLCTAERLAKVFKVEVSSPILGDILEVLEACWLSSAGAAEDNGQGGEALQEAAFVLEVLQSLTGSGRFGLNTKLLSKKSKDAGTRLFDSLSQAHTLLSENGMVEGGQLAGALASGGLGGLRGKYGL